MERAERLSAVSGAGLMLIGLVAMVAMAIAANADSLRERLIIWIGAAFVTLVVGGLATWLKARRNRLMLIGDPGRRFLLCLIPVLVVGGVMTSALWGTPANELLPNLWTMLYGCGVLAAGTYAVAPITLAYQSASALGGQPEDELGPLSTEVCRGERVDVAMPEMPRDLLSYGIPRDLPKPLI